VERDKYRGEVKEIFKTLKKNQEDKERLMVVLKEKLNSLDSDLKNAETEALKMKEENQKLDKLVKSLQNERDKMRQRIQKLKSRRIFNINQKICKLCGKEYLEKENFNWSCRTHIVI
jgi:peptidoglycan hydrolase CwlO-like protein